MQSGVPEISKLPLRKSHPALFKSLVVKALFILVAGLFIATGNANYVIEETVISQGGAVAHPLIPIQLWGALFIVCGSMLMYGITNGLSRYKWARRGMIFAAGLCGIFAIGYWFAFAQGFTERIFAPLLWSYLTAQFIIWSGEPAFNPLSSALDDKSYDDDRDIRG